MTEIERIKLLIKESEGVELSTWHLTTISQRQAYERIEVHGREWLSSLITTIESLQAENSELLSSELAVNYQNEILANEQLKTQLDAQKEETASWEKEVEYRDLEIKRQIKNGLENRREAVKFEKQVESLKAITELAVKGLEQVMLHAVTSSAPFNIAVSVTKQIEKLQNG